MRNVKVLALLAALLAAGMLPAGAASSPALGEGATAALPIPPAFENADDVPLPDPDLWYRIRMGFALEPLDSPLVAEQEDWYASRPDYIKRFVDRGSLYLHYIVEQVEKRHMPMEIALLPVVESAFAPNARSSAKATGLWQFIPSTGRNYGLKQDWWRDNRRDVIAATDAALNYLQRLHDMFGDWELALAAYNCGEGCVARAVAYNQKRGLPTDYLSLKLPPETASYVPKLMAVKNIVLSPATYGVELESVPDEPYFTMVKAPARIDVKVAAQLAGMTVEEFTALNPAYTKPVAVASTGTLVLPLDKAEQFRENLESYDKPLVSWTTYRARRGEYLGTIARRHGMSYAALRAANEGARLDRRGRLLRTGPIIVPIRQKSRRVTGVSVHTASLGGAVRSHGTRSYTVRPGDTLFGIARRFGTSVATLERLNRLSGRSTIHPGLRLRLP